MVLRLRLPPPSRLVQVMGKTESAHAYSWLRPSLTRIHDASTHVPCGFQDFFIKKKKRTIPRIPSRAVCPICPAKFVAYSFVQYWYSIYNFQYNLKPRTPEPVSLGQI